jgi:hypothetical protein
MAASGATLSGRCPVFPGNAVDVSITEPVLFVWWFRPVRSAARVGELRAVVWNWLYLRPLFARRSAVGILTGPPKALDCPNPISSMRIMRTFGAPAGALTSNRGGGVAFRTSTIVLCGIRGSGIGSAVRSNVCAAPVAAHNAVNVAPMPAVTTLPFITCLLNLKKTCYTVRREVLDIILFLSFRKWPTR